MYEKNLKLYDELVALSDRYERKGKTMPYTSANGYMFSLLNKAGEFGIRLPKEAAKQFMEKYESGPFKSYGAVMRDYVIIPQELLADPKTLIKYLEDSFDYVMSLPPK